MAVEEKVSKPQKPKGSPFNRFFKATVSFFNELKAEAKRITWASKSDLKKATAAVLGFCVIYVILVGIMDIGFKNLYRLIFNVG